MAIVSDGLNITLHDKGDTASELGKDVYLKKFVFLGFPI
jgi:hypothetical protein